MGVSVVGFTDLYGNPSFRVVRLWRRALHPAKPQQTVATRYSFSAVGSAGISSGSPLFFHALNPPLRGRTFLIPNLLSCSAARALEASFGQVQ